MSEIPYSFYKVADITQVADSEKIAGAIFFDDATECVYVYGVDGTPVIYGSRKWTWSGINYNIFVNEVSVGDCVLWSSTELTIVARKDISADNAVKVTLISDKGFNTLTFRKAATATEWSFVSSVVEDFDDFVKNTEVSEESAAYSIVKRDWHGGIMADFFFGPETFYWVLPSSPDELKEEADGILQEEISDLEEIREGASKGATSVQQEEVSEEVQPNTIPKRDSTGDIWTRGIVSEGQLYALPRTALANSGNEDFNLQEQIEDLEEIREGAVKGMAAVQKSGDTMTGALIVPNVVGDLQGTSDFAKELTGRVESTEEEFVFRASAGGKSIRDGSAVIRSIKGNTVVWNQAVKNADFSEGFNSEWDHYNTTVTTNTDGSIRVTNNTGDAQGIYQDYNGATIQANDKVFAWVKYKRYGNNNSQVRFYLHKTSGGYDIGFVQVSSSQQECSAIISITDKIDMFRFYPYSEGEIGSYCDIFSCGVVNLTQMFGAGNEPMTVEEFYARKPIGIDETAYNEGEIINLATNAIETVGFNAFDASQAEYGTIVDDGNTTTSSIYYNGIVEVLPNMAYYLKDVANGNNTITGAYYNANMDLISTFTLPSLPVTLTNVSGTVTTPNNTSFMRIVVHSDYLLSCCVNLSHTGIHNGEYKPYERHTRDLPEIIKYFPNGMRSAGSVKDEICFNTVAQKWEAVQRIGIVDLGTLDWTYSAITDTHPYGFFYSSLKKNLLDKKYGGGVLSSLYVTSFSGWNVDKVIKSNASNNMIYIIDSAYTDVTTFKTAMSGVMLNYELAEPIVTSITEPLQTDYWVKDFGTERAISNVASTPFKADIVYQFNAIDRIRDNARNIELLEKGKLDNPNGTSSQFIKGNGSLDSNTYCKLQTVSLLTASGNITKDVYDAMITADIVKFIYNDGQYELTMSSKEKSNYMIMYSTVFFSAVDNAFKSFSVIFSAPSDSSNAVSYQITLSNLAIGTIAISE